MPFAVSVSAFEFSLFGASHCRRYHARIRSRACGSDTLSGNSDSGRERVLGLFVRDELGRAAEVAALSDLRRVEHRNRLAALAACRDLLGLPSARSVGNRAERKREIVLDDDGLAPRVSSSAGDSVPQNGQISACLVGFQCDSAPQAGQ